MMKRELWKERLESMIDQSSVREVLDIIGDICDDKADHVKANWQDSATAKEWEKKARKINRLAGTFAT